MKALIVITDSDAVPAFERAFLESGDRGFTVVPTVWGRGRSGLKTGDRVHPGGCSLLFTVVPEDEADAALSWLRDVAGRRVRWDRHLEEGRPARGGLTLRAVRDALPHSLVVLFSNQVSYWISRAR